MKFLSKFCAEQCRAPASSSSWDLVWPVRSLREPAGHRPPPSPPQRHRGTPEAQHHASKLIRTEPSSVQTKQEQITHRAGTCPFLCQVTTLNDHSWTACSLPWIRPRGRRLERRSMPLAPRFPLSPDSASPEGQRRRGHFSSGSTFVFIKGDTD